MRPLKKTLKTDFDNGYDAARRRLITDIGSYCSYCEAVVSSDVPVEHKLPKKYVKYAETASFNLLIACHACNNAKGARPETNGRSAANDYQLAALMIGDMMWPDTYQETRVPWPKPDEGWLATTATFRYFRQAYSQVDLAGLKLLPLTSAEGKEDWAQEKKDMIWIAPNERLTSPEEERARATINILKLNRHNDVDPGHNDRRVLNRTLAWNSAENAAERLIGDIVPILGRRGQTPCDRFLNDNWAVEMDLIRHSAIMTGYWSVWMTVFGKALRSEPGFNRDPELRSEILRCLFVARERDKEPLIFSGTDVDRIRYQDFLR